MGLRANMAMWAGNHAARRAAPAVATRGAQHFVDRAIDGFPGFPGAREVARKHLERRRDVDRAVRDVIEQHVRLAGVQGFVANLGGVVTLPVAIPANIAGIAVLHLRMAAAIAYLRGYDLADSRVRTAALMTLLGRDGAGAFRQDGAVSTLPHDVAVARNPIEHVTIERVAARVGQELTARVGGKHATLMIAKRVPVIGGAVSAGVDAVSTWSVGRYADSQFPTNVMVERA
ncbi:EcsC family protein [Phytoactinopolyspora halotolerans]|uniref:EcsC family protein n=1 Tax=Phytoactinopolyspora halotolerans TaxID=1981512 RepID=A0A6L9S4A0_9ACTN|nr:EcsC family protein [Phytoactinopolyspora halotolerans]NED98829.1 EcsC family protein [Phytoactinopolyspora halotolerans]